MKTALLDQLVCPETLNPLDLSVVESWEGDVQRGKLSSSKDQTYVIENGIPSFAKAETLNEQTTRSFAQKWAKHDYYRQHTGRFYRQWYWTRYGFGDSGGLQEFLRGKQTILDAGTGSGRDAVMFAELSEAEVFAVDLASEALSIAAKQVDHPRVSFVHSDLNALPFKDEYFDFISCDQVIHHTPDPRATFERLRRKLKTGGSLCCYVYSKKAPIREFVDDFVRQQISKMLIDEALEVCEGITALGQSLASLNATVNIKREIPILGIKKGDIDIQQLFHWCIMKCFWNDEFDFFTNNIINYDWYHPAICHRYRPEEFRSWFEEGWVIEHWDEQEAGTSCRARKI